MFLVYYGYYEHWSVFAPSSLSFAFILYLIGLKVYLEVYLPRKNNGIGGSSSPLQGGKMSDALLPENASSSDTSNGNLETDVTASDRK